MIPSPDSLDSQHERIYTDSDGLFAIAVPRDWLVDTSGQSGTRVFIFHPREENQFRRNVNVMVHELSALSPEQYLTLSRLQLMQLTGLARLPVDQTKAGDANAHVFEWAVDRPPVPVKVRQYVIFSPGMAFVVTATGTLGTFENHRQEFDKVLDSFRLRPASL